MSMRADNPRGGGGRAARRGRRREPVEDSVRFACGHSESHESAVGRARQTARAAWIPCARCNVVTLVIAQSVRRRRDGRRT
jgi:hypothetical protein